MNCNTYFILILLFLLGGSLQPSTISGQTKVFVRPPSDNLKKDKSGKKFTLHSEDNQIIDTRVSPPIQYLNGNVKVFHTGTFMYCDTAIIRGPILRMRHNVVMLQNDTIQLFADSMVYNADSLIAYLYGDIVMKNGKKTLYTNKLKYNSGTKTAEYNENALLEQDSSTVVSRKGVYKVANRLIIFKENVLVNGSDFTLVTDSIGFQTETQIATFLSPTRITRDTVNIYAESGWFDLDDKKGDFIQNAQYSSGSSKAMADTIHYDGKNDLIILSSDKKTSQYIAEKDTVIANKINYNKKLEYYQLTGSVFYKSPDNEVVGEYVEYNKKTEKFKTLGRGTVSDPPLIITADSLDYDKFLKIGIGNGKVIWQDTAAKTTMYADHMRYRGNENFMLAYNDPGSRPHFTTLVDTNLMHMKADTFKSIRRLNTLDSLQTDTLDYFIGFNKVRLYKNDMQMVCDSLAYSLKDSVFTLYTKPVMWSDTTQLTGDTMLFYLKNKVMDKLVIRENGTVINSEDLTFYNQIKGRLIEGYFEKGKMKNMKVDGDAEVIYYLKDDKKLYIGVNQSKSSNINFKMSGNQISDILFYIDVKSKVFPMSVNHESLKIKGFRLESESRPKGVDDL
jgi:lipopolysaccharide export system protein LptA